MHRESQKLYQTDIATIALNSSHGTPSTGIFIPEDAVGIKIQGFAKLQTAAEADDNCIFTLATGPDNTNWATNATRHLVGLDQGSDTESRGPHQTLDIAGLWLRANDVENEADGGAIEEVNAEVSYLRP